MDAEKVSAPNIQTGVQPNTQSSTIPPVTSNSVHKPNSNMLIFVGLFLFIIIAGGTAGYFLLPTGSIKIPSAVVTTPTITPSPTVIPAPTPVLCSDPPCLAPQFLACTSSRLTMPFMDGSSFVVTVYGKENGLCRYGLTIVDTKTNALLNSSECKVPMEKITKDTFGHLFGQDKAAGQETIKAEQDKLENDYCMSKGFASTPSPGLSPQVSPTPKKVTCGNNDPMCVFTNIIDGFTTGCKPVEVTTTTDTGGQVALTISSGENGACRFQMKGLGVNQDCLFAKENVTTLVIKGMLGMDNIPKDPEFIKIKAASCK
jgi:hypothetical protein